MIDDTQLLKIQRRHFGGPATYGEMVDEERRQLRDAVREIGIEARAAIFGVRVPKRK